MHDGFEINVPTFFDHFNGKHPVISGLIASGTLHTADTWELNQTLLDADQGQFQKLAPSIARLTVPSAGNNKQTYATPKGGQNDYFCHSGNDMLLRTALRTNFSVSGADCFFAGFTSRTATSGMLGAGTGAATSGFIAGVTTVSGLQQWHVIGQSADGSDRVLTRTRSNVISGKFYDVIVRVNEVDTGIVNSGGPCRSRVVIELDGMPVVDFTQGRPIQTNFKNSGAEGKPVVGFLQGGGSVASVDVDFVKVQNGVKTASLRPS